MHIVIINGPNLNLLGQRETGVYGNVTMESYLVSLRENFPSVQLDYFQSNVEGEIINHIHQVGFKADGIIINAGGYTHTSVSISDALRSVSAPYIEVHISNVFARESFRHTSLLSADALGVITGFGLDSYSLALVYFTAFRSVR